MYLLEFLYMVDRDMVGGLIDLIDHDVGKLIKGQVEMFIDEKTEISVVCFQRGDFGFHLCGAEFQSSYALKDVEEGIGRD